MAHFSQPKNPAELNVATLPPRGRFESACTEAVRLPATALSVTAHVDIGRRIKDYRRMTHILYKFQSGRIAGTGHAATLTAPLPGLLLASLLMRESGRAHG